MTRQYTQRVQTCPVCKKDFISTFRNRPAPYGKCWKTYCSYRCNALRNGPRGESHPGWKGDQVSYQALHEWVRKNSSIPRDCQKCGCHADVEAANISGQYKRDLSDWVFVCKSCHVVMDGIAGNRNADGTFKAKKHRNSFIPYPRAYRLKHGIS